MSNSRRDFVKTAAGLSLAAGALSAAPAGDEIPNRTLGSTGLEVSIFGLGGARTGMLVDHQQAMDTIRRCYDLGVTYFDTAAAGAYGISQLRYGLALSDVREKIVFGTKTRHRTYGHSELDLNQSLANLKTDRIDLYQIHNVMNQEDLEFIFGPRGVMEMVEKAKRDGKIRFVGVTGHMDPRVLRTAIDTYDFDTILIPLSVTDGARDGFSFEQTTLPVALEKKMGVIAMKTTGVGALPSQNDSSIAECLNYVWSLPISTAILGCTTPEQAETDARLAREFPRNQLSEAQREEIRAKWAKADLAKLEPWKVDQSNKLAALPEYMGD